MRSYEGDDYEVEFVWKEVVTYWEGDHAFSFDAPWGVDPGVYSPSVAIWAEVMPDWLRKRRDEVVGRLRDHSGHDPTEDSTATTGTAPRRAR